MRGPEQMVAGQLFAGDYRVVRPLASGGMGAVYVVEQLSTGRQRALKLMHPELASDPASRERFEREARVGARIRSDHVVEVAAAGIDAETGAPWLAMELLEGEDLAQVLSRRGRLSPAEAHALFEQLCHALAAAHTAGIVHRDLKPENIFVGTSRRVREAMMVKILDFGIAKWMQGGRQATSASQAIGTPRWMAPEQTSTHGTVGPATDVWALGLIAFHVLTGRYYWLAANEPNGSYHHVLAEMLVQPLASASSRATELGVTALLPEGFDGWFSRCVSRAQDQRYHDAAAAFEGLSPLLSASAPRLAQTQPLGPARAAHEVTPSDPGALDGATLQLPPQTNTAPLCGELAPSPPARVDARRAPSLEATPARRVEAPKTMPLGPAPLEPSPVEVPREASPPAQAEAPRTMRLDPSPVQLEAPARIPFEPSLPTRVEAERKRPPAALGALALVAVTSATLGLWAAGVFESAPEQGCEPPRVRVASACMPVPESPLPERDGCLAGDMAACDRAGDLARFRPGAPPDDDAARAFEEIACASGRLGACNDLGGHYREGWGVGQSNAAAVDRFRATCEAGDAAGCFELASMTLAGRGVPRDATAAAALFRRACEGGEVLGCVDLAALYEHGLGVSRDVEEAAGLRSRACDSGSGTACATLAENLEAARGESRDPVRATDLRRRALEGHRAHCEAGGFRAPPSCALEGQHLVLGIGGAAQQDRGIALLERACEGRSSWACAFMGDSHAEGRGVPRDPARAERAYRAAAERRRAMCDGGQPSGCMDLAWMFSAGRGVEQDEVEATRLFERACEAELPHACWSLAGRLVHGLGAPQDREAALGHYRWACDHGVLGACTDLGSLLVARGDHDVEALRLHQLACDGGVPRACTEAGRLIGLGRGGRADPAVALQLHSQSCEDGVWVACHRAALAHAAAPDGAGEGRAVELYRRACESGYAGSCTNLGVMHARGRGVSRSQDRAAELYRRACDGGDAVGCENLSICYSDLSSRSGVRYDMTEANHWAARARELRQRASP